MIVIWTITSAPKTITNTDKNHAAQLEDDEYTAWYMCRQRIEKDFPNATFERSNLRITKEYTLYQVDAFFNHNGKLYTFVCKIQKTQSNQWLVKALRIE